MEDRNNVKVIQRQDSDFPAPKFNFEELRRIGLEHIGELSGKIWTDHNVHDPGVTMLEVLCYAMLDLGYRSKLPIQDILALNVEQQQEEDNFFTPAQILTSNPTTILDYRKMLIDISGVQNAWLEIAEDVAPPLYLNCPSEEWQQSAGLTCWQGEHPVHLNGLYRVKVLMDREGSYCNNGKASNEKKKRVVKEIKERLLQHRNLGEDFLDIQVLREEQLGILADLEVEATANPEEVYVNAMKQLSQFFNPGLDFYTLQELLDKGKPIEEAFAGRPFSEESFGFIDTEQLESLELPKEIHLSDVHRLLMDIDGVQSVRRLSIRALVNGEEHLMESGSDCSGYVFHLAAGHAPAFCIDLSQLRLIRNSSAYRLEPQRLERLLGRAFGTKRNTRFKDPALSGNTMPYGIYRKELGRYYSIQNDLPRNYGIGEDGLSEDASDERKAQAKQLKAFLLFFDQLLAGYLSQLANIRNLFSMTPDSHRRASHRHTYFSQRLDSVANVDELVRFYTPSADDASGLSDGDVLAYPVDVSLYQELLEGFEQEQANEREFSIPILFWETQMQRQAIVEQLRREFEQGEEVKIDTWEEKCGFFFVVRVESLDYGLISKKRYPNREEARLAAESVVFLGTLQNAYQEENQLDTGGDFSFELVSRPVDYLSFLHNLIEEETAYLQRRNQFLDHLLARFSESFTDYSLILFEASEKEKAEKKAQLLQQYDDISRNRGRAFNYCEESWDKDNVSGLEKRVAALSGITEFQRRNLCNFEVARRKPEFGFVLRDYRGDIIFSSNERYLRQRRAGEAASVFIESLSQWGHYQPEDNFAESKYDFLLRFDTNYALFNRHYASAQERNHAMWAVSALFRDTALESDLFVAAHRYQLIVENKDGEAILEEKSSTDNKDKALEQLTSFVQKTASLKRAGGDEVKAKLEPVAEGAQTYVDILGLESLCELSSARFRWQLVDGRGKQLIRSQEFFEEPQLAMEAFVKVAGSFSKKWRVQTEEVGQQQAVSLENTRGKRIGVGYFPDTELQKEAADKVARFFEQKPQNGKYVFKSEQAAYGWQLLSADNKPLLESTKYYREKNHAQGAFESLLSAGKSLKKLKFFPTTGKKGYLQLENKQGKILARSPVFSVRQKKNEKEWREKAKEALSSGNKVNLLEKKESFGFHIPAAKEDAGNLLESYCLYDNPVEAWQALEAASRLSKKKKTFISTGDQPSRNFTFYLQEPDGEFVAFHPETYLSDANRNKALNDVQKALRSFKPPIATKKEYAYLIRFEDGQEALHSTGVFSTETQARKAAVEMLKYAVSSANLPEKRAGTRQWLLQVEGPSGPLARSGTVKSAAGLQAVRKPLVDALSQYTYQGKAIRVPHSYKFRFWWCRADGKAEPLVESKSPFAARGRSSGLKRAREEYQAFVKGIREGRISIDENSDGLALMEGETTVAIRPKAYGSQPPQNEVEGLLTYMREFGERRDAASWEYVQTLEMPPVERGSTPNRYVYRLTKPGMPLAFHPCACFEQDETGADDATGLLETLYEYGREGYDYMEICLSGDITCLINKKYHYVIRDQKASYSFPGRETGKVITSKIPYFISYKGYETKEKAVEAFQQEYLQGILLASCIENYCLAQDGNTGMETGATGEEECHKKIWAFDPEWEEEGEKACPPDDEPMLFMPWATVCHFEETGGGGLEEVVRRFCSYPIRPIKVRPKETPKAKGQWQYYFRLTGMSGCNTGDDCVADWVSVKCYETIKEARAALRQFEYLLSSIVSYRMFRDEDGLLGQRAQGRCPDWEVLEAESCSPLPDEETGTGGHYPCCQYIGLSEVLAESRLRYATPEDAWGGSLMLSCEGWESFEEACEQLYNFWRQCQPQMEPGEHGIAHRSGSYYVIQSHPNLPSLESATGFDDESQADAYFHRIEGLLRERCRDLSYYRIQMGRDCLYHFALAGHWDEGHIGTRLEECLDALEAAYQDCRRPAFRSPRGLEQFLQAANGEMAIEPYSSYQEGELCFSFYIVGADYLLARHPFQYSTPAERDRQVLELCSCINGLCDTLSVRIEPIQGREDCHYVVYCDENEGSEPDESGKRDEYNPIAVAMVVGEAATTPSGSRRAWMSYDTFCECTDGDAAHKEAEDFLLSIMPYAREERFYYFLEGKTYLCSQPYDPDIGPATNLENNIEAGTVLAVNHHEEGWAPAGDLLAIARQYPFIKRENGIGFQLYCEGLSLNKLGDDTPCEICPPEDESSGDTWNSGTGYPAPEGAVIWESASDYPDLETAHCYYRWFCHLLQDRSAIKLTGDEKCGPYSMEVIDPMAILATHPQCYSMKAEREAAIARFKACINSEGFHLVEHILLRPGRGCQELTGNEMEACDCLLPAAPDCNCVLKYQRFEDDPCREELSSGTGTDECDEEAYFDEYIPGADPYSFWLTVVLPNWPKRFRRHDFREAFQDLIRREAPAHLGLNIIWAGPQEFCHFEQHYRQWLRWLQGKELCGREGIVCSFIQRLFRLHYCPDLLEGHAGDQQQHPLALVNISNLSIFNLLSFEACEELSSSTLGGRLAATSNIGALPYSEPLKARTPSMRLSEPERRVVAEEQKKAPAVKARGLKPQPEAKAEKEKPPKKKKPANKKKAASKAQPKKKAQKEAPKARKAKKDSSKEQKSMEKPLTGSEKRRLVRRRMASYRKVVESEADSKLKKTRTYEETIKFFEKGAGPDAFITAIDYNIQYGLSRKKTKQEKAPYVTLLQNVVWRFLDQQVSENPGQVQKESILKDAFKKLRSERFDMKQLASGWNASELAEWTDAKVTDEYLKLITKR